MTPADELRAAAATIRARAEAATPGPWGVDDYFDTVYSDARAGQTVAHTYDSGPDSKHIVIWSPHVALAVAGMLDEALPYAALRDPESYPVVVSALVLARLVNGAAT